MAITSCLSNFPFKVFYFGGSQNVVLDHWWSTDKCCVLLISDFCSLYKHWVHIRGSPCAHYYRGKKDYYSHCPQEIYSVLGKMFYLAAQMLKTPLGSGCIENKIQISYQCSKCLALTVFFIYFKSFLSIINIMKL